MIQNSSNYNISSSNNLLRLRTSKDDRSNEKNGFTLKKERKWYPVNIITDVEYVDDIALLENTPI